MAIFSHIQLALLPANLFNLPFQTIDIQAIQKLPAIQFWFFIVVISGFALHFFYQYYKNFTKARKIQDIPTAKIRSAAQGYIELEGIQKSLPKQKNYGFLTKRPCTWYRYTIQQYINKRWEIIEHGVSTRAFLLDDGTGICLVDPTDAQITTHVVDRWQGFRLHPEGKPTGFFNRLFSALLGRYRYQEWRMEEGMPLYALGQFTTTSFDINLYTQSKRFRKEVNLHIRKWKKNMINLIVEFDADQDGKLTDQDWEKVITKASKKIEKKWHFTDSQEINILSGEGLDKSHPFVLTNRPQKSIVRALKWTATIWLMAYIVMLTLDLWLISVYLE